MVVFLSNGFPLCAMPPSRLFLWANIVMIGENFFSSEHLLGITLLFSAAIIYTFHMVGVRLWGFTWQDVFVVVPVVNAVLFLPLWFFSRQLVSRYLFLRSFCRQLTRELS